MVPISVLMVDMYNTHTMVSFYLDGSRIVEI